MRKTLTEIAEMIGGKVVGDEHLVVTGLSGIQEAVKGDLTFVANSKYLSLASETKASAVILPKGLELEGIPFIQTDNPSLAFARVAAECCPQKKLLLKGVHSSSVIADNARLPASVAVGPLAVIEEGVVIGEDTVIHAGCYIGMETKIGKGCVIYPNTTIREFTNIGDRVVVHSGTVIGCDGFGYEKSDGRHVKIPQIGIVEIHDDVEIGSNVTIDRARFNKTVIGKGTKIDNLVQIAHNVIIGEHCVIIAQVGISGSVKIEDGVILAGQAGVAGHLTIGANAVVGAQSGVTKSVPANTMVSGYPARAHDEARKQYAAAARLPEQLKVINDLKQRIEFLEKKINNE